jgi:16S rRNA processing protein RimM
MDRERVVIAEVLRPRGNRGEVIAVSQSDVPGRFESLTQAMARLADDSDLPVQIEAAWQHKGAWVLKFEGVDTIAAAERFRGAELWVSFNERAHLPPGEYFQADLVGCQVYESESSRPIGTVTGWQHNGATSLMEVSAGGREILLPFVGSWYEVDLAQKVIRADLPEGLLSF